VRDPEASVRRQAIRQLGTRRVRRATQVLLARLHDEDASVRFRAATALGRIGDSAAVPGGRLVAGVLGATEAHADLLPQAMTTTEGGRG
jgi:hypothetical protein